MSPPTTRPWTHRTFYAPKRDEDVAAPDLDETRAAGDVLADLIDEFGPCSNLSESDLLHLGLTCAVDE